eukprot:TRINITY_DN104353_c0_g1_i1.p1 TRINITY_DN104353_c0_g1~~TRINITY_DN104353_c0_g1_i1.p1  ORF type:complete len:272 (-),score=58.35 TRINITY_DN104353_c0_g1_i1:116-868(-)
MTEPAPEEAMARTALLEFASEAVKAGALPGHEGALSEELEGIIRSVAQTGAAHCYPWDALRLLLARKVECVLSDFYRDAPDLPLREGETFQGQTVEPLTRSLLEPQREGAPWTTQRLCELLAEPRSSYTSTRKYVYALQRTVLVTSTEEAIHPQPRSQGSAGSLAGVRPPVGEAAAAVALGESAGVQEAAPAHVDAASPTPPLAAAEEAEEAEEPAEAAAAVEGDVSASTPLGRKRKLPEELANGAVSEE